MNIIISSCLNLFDRIFSIHTDMVEYDEKCVVKFLRVNLRLFFDDLSNDSL